MAENKCRHCNGTGVARPNVLETLRRRDNFTGSDVAGKLGITQSAYSRIETAAGQPDGLRWNRHARALAELYKVTTDQIYGRAPLTAEKKPRPVRAPDKASLAKSARAKKAIRAKQPRRRR